MAWHRPGDKALPEPMMVSLLTHICVTQWVKFLTNCWCLSYFCDELFQGKIYNWFVAFLVYSHVITSWAYIYIYIYTVKFRLLDVGYYLDLYYFCRKRLPEVWWRLYSSYSIMLLTDSVQRLTGINQLNTMGSTIFCSVKHDQLSLIKFLINCFYTIKFWLGCENSLLNYNC